MRTFLTSLLMTLAVSASFLGASMPDGIYLDEGYTWFKAENTQDSADGNPVDLGFYLIPEYRVWGPVPKRSAFRTVVSQGGSELANIRCEGEEIQDFSSLEGITIALKTANYCKDARTQRIKTDGFVDVDLYYIDGRSSEEFFVRSFVIDVRTVDRVRGMANKPEWDSPRYYIARHGEASHAIIQQRDKGHILYGGKNVHGISQANHVLIYFSTSPHDDIKRYTFDTDFVRCTVGGQPVNFGRNDAIHIADWRHFDVVHSDRDLDELKRGSAYKERIRFNSYALNMPLTYGDEFAAVGMLKMDEYPGDWECVWESQGNILRTFRWTVDSEGSVVAHAEEDAGLTLAPRTHLIDMEIPAGGTVIDERLVNAAGGMGGFYGRPWQSSEQQYRVDNLPDKGSPFPVRSSDDRADVAEDQRAVYAAVGGGGGSGWIHCLVWLLLSFVLIAMGLHCLKGMLPEQIRPYIGMMKPYIGKIGLTAVGIALIDFLIDLMNLRPFVGDILPQLTAVLVGAHLARGAGESLLSFMDPYHKQVMSLIGNNEQSIGALALVMGVLHLFMGSTWFF